MKGKGKEKAGVNAQGSHVCGAKKKQMAVRGHEREKCGGGLDSEGLTFGVQIGSR